MIGRVSFLPLVHMIMNHIQGTTPSKGQCKILVLAMFSRVPQLTKLKMIYAPFLATPLMYVSKVG